MSFDISDTLAPNSDQLDAVDLLSGPRTFTVDRVTKGNAEQPIQVHFKEFPRPWRPGVNQRRVLGNVWGTDSANWPGRRLTLFCDPDVPFGGQKVGGIRVSHMSHITKRTGTPIIPTRGKSTIYTVDPLKEGAATSPAAPEPTAEEVAACTDRDELRAMYRRSGPERQEQIKQRVADLDNEPGGE